MATVLQTTKFAKWLKNAEVRARILMRIRHLSVTENFGDVRPVGDGVYEVRIEHGPGYRPYRTKRGQCVSFAPHRQRQNIATAGHRESKKLNLEYR